MKALIIILLSLSTGCSLEVSVINLSEPGSKIGAANPNGKTCVDSFVPNSHMSAITVIGQPDFISKSANQGGAAGANTIDTPDGVSILSNGQIYIGEFFNHRYLIFDKIPEVNNAFADRVFGQPDFSTTTANTGGVSGLSLWTGRNVSWNGNQFFMADFINNRVLIWNSIPTSSSVHPDFVLGQSSLVLML